MQGGVEKLQKQAIKVLLGYLRGDDEEDPVVQKAALALGSLNAVARLKATDRARDATQFHVVRSLAQDPKMLEKYIRATLPHLMPTPLLTD